MLQFAHAFYHTHQEISKLCVSMFTHTHTLFFISNATTNEYIIGNGKVKTKEPLEMANKAIAQLQEIVEIASKLE